MTENIIFIVVTLISVVFAVYFYRDAVNQSKRVDSEIEKENQRLGQLHL